MMRNILCFLMLAAPAYADGEASWEAFRAEVAATCLALPDAPEGAAVEVSPFGSESYGAALMTVVSDGQIWRQICIFDKSTRVAELAAPFTPVP